MKALSILQPWAYWIAEGVKLYENRAWTPPYLAAQLAICPIGSNFLIHAGRSMTPKNYYAAVQFAIERCGLTRIPPMEYLPRGGIVAVATLEAVVKASKDPWFVGPLALRLSNVQPLRFVPCKGALGFFNVELEWEKVAPGAPPYTVPNPDPDEPGDSADPNIPVGMVPAEPNKGRE